MIAIALRPERIRSQWICTSTSPKLLPTHLELEKLWYTALCADTSCRILEGSIMWSRYASSSVAWKPEDGGHHSWKSWWWKLQKSSSSQGKSKRDSSKRFFIHMKYHPRGITRQQVRAAFDDTCDNFRGTAAEVEQVTVALSRPTNLSDELISARLYQPKGRETSTFRPKHRNPG